LRLRERKEEGNEKKPYTCTWPLEKGCCDAFNAVTKDNVCSLVDVACAALRVRTPSRHQHQPLLIF